MFSTLYFLRLDSDVDVSSVFMKTKVEVESMMEGLILPILNIT